jgi:hypothetical protein
MAGDQQPVSKVEAMRLALRELGDAPPEELSAYLERRFGLMVAPAFIPILKASVRELEHLEKVRQAARALAEQQARSGDGKAEK